MIKLALCDDDAKELALAKKLLEEYAATRHSLSIHAFASPIELLKARDNQIAFDIFLLDIIMPGMSGLSLGKVLREDFKEACIIFFTTSPEYALDAYGISALQYLLKPIQKEALFRALDQAVVLFNKRGRVYLIPGKDEKVATKLDDLLYVEYRGHVNTYYLSSKKIVGKYTRVAFSASIAEIAQNEQFIQTHESFLVNMSHVQKMDQNTFTMDNGVIVPISKSHQKNVRTRYTQYLLQGEKADV